MVCFGSGLVDYGQTRPPPSLLFSSVVASKNHTCGLQRNGTAVCFGLCSRDTRCDVSGFTNVVQLTAGEGFT